MRKTPYQFRYYGEQTEGDREKNYPSTLTKAQLTTSNIFADYNKHFITRIGIQSTPGVQFKLNDGENWIEIGKTGIYELDLEGKGHIENIIFNNNLAMSYRNPEMKKFYLFIDIIYQDQDDSILLDKDFYNENNNYDLIISGGDSDGEEQINE